MGSIIKKLRVERGLTQEELAKKSGLSRLCIVSIESNGLGKAKASTVIALANALGVDGGFLLASIVSHE